LDYTVSNVSVSLCVVSTIFLPVYCGTWRTFSVPGLHSQASSKTLFALIWRRWNSPFEPLSPNRNNHLRRRQFLLPSYVSSICQSPTFRVCSHRPCIQPLVPARGLFAWRCPTAKSDSSFLAPHPLKSRTVAISKCFHGSLISGRSRSKRWARRLLSVKPRKRPFVRSAPTSALRTLSHTAPLSRVNCPLKSLRSLEPLPKEVGKWWPSSAKGHISRTRQTRGPQTLSRVMASSYRGQWSPLLHYHVSAIPKPAHTRR
jgi:hypothetical protein